MKSWKKALIGGAGLGAVIAGALTARRVITNNLAEYAIVRVNPDKVSKGKSKVSGSKKTSEELAAIKAEALELEACEHDVVEISSYDGVKLVGHYFPAKKPKRIIIAMHGWKSAWSFDYARYSEFFRKKNCSVLYVEQRGQNASGGDYMGFGIIERYDCLQWAKYASENISGELPIYLLGVSMGAATVMMASDLELPCNVAGIIADCGYTSPKAIWKHVMEKNLHIPYSFVSGEVDKAYKKYINVECGFSCVDALSKTTIPVLFIHGTDDKFVPIEMTYENYKACASNKELLVVPGAGHVGCYRVDKERYELYVNNFFKKCDKF